MNNANARMSESNVGYASRTILVLENSMFKRYAMRTLHHLVIAANRLVGCADSRRRIERDRCASRCSAHPINRRVGTAVSCPPLKPRGQTKKLFAHPTGLAGLRYE
jgi:hypothetical protein